MPKKIYRVQKIISNKNYILHRIRHRKVTNDVLLADSYTIEKFLPEVDINIPQDEFTKKPGK